MTGIEVENLATTTFSNRQLTRFVSPFHLFQGRLQCAGIHLPVQIPPRSNGYAETFDKSFLPAEIVLVRKISGPEVIRIKAVGDRPSHREEIKRETRWRPLDAGVAASQKLNEAALSLICEVEGHGDPIGALPQDWHKDASVFEAPRDHVSGTLRDILRISWIVRGPARLPQLKESLQVFRYAAFVSDRYPELAIGFDALQRGPCIVPRVRTHAGLEKFLPIGFERNDDVHIVVD